MAAPRVLLVGRIAQSDLLAAAVRDSGCEVADEPDRLAIPGAIAAFRPDAVVLTAGPDDLDGIAAACRRARESADVPVVVVVDRFVPDIYEAVLSVGGADCITANHPIEIILSRIRAVLIRRARLAPPAVQIGDLLIDEAAHVVLKDGEAVALSPLEFGLLLELARHPGLVMRKSDLLQHLWSRYGARNSLEQAVSRLRRKIDGTCTVHTVRGVGYVLWPNGDEH